MAPRERDQLQGVSCDLMELAASQSTLVSVDLDEHRLVGADTVDIDAGTVLEP
jgi:hypothetical protein